MDQNIADLISGAGDTGWDRFRKGFGAMTAQGARPGSILGLLGGALSMARSPSDVAKEQYAAQLLKEQAADRDAARKQREIENRLNLSERIRGLGGTPGEVRGMGITPVGTEIQNVPFEPIGTAGRLFEKIYPTNEQLAQQAFPLPNIGGSPADIVQKMTARTVPSEEWRETPGEAAAKSAADLRMKLAQIAHPTPHVPTTPKGDTAIIQKTASENIKNLNAKLELLLKEQQKQKQNFLETGHNVFTDKTGKKVYTDPANDAAIAELERQVEYWNQMYNQAGGVTGPERPQQPSTGNVSDWTGGGVTQGGGTVSIVGGEGSPKPETPPQPPPPRPVAPAPAPGLPFMTTPPVAPPGQGFTASVKKPTWQSLLQAQLGGGDVEELKRQAMDEYKQAEAEYKKVVKAGGAGQRLKIGTNIQYGKSPISAQYEYTDKDYPKILKRLQDAKKVLEAYGLQSGSF